MAGPRRPQAFQSDIVHRKVLPLNRRELLKSATLLAGGGAAATLPIALADPAVAAAAAGARLRKIALEEHFMVPDFVEYFAETYPNISPEIRKFGTTVLHDLGDRRIAIMDEYGIDFVVLSLAGPGVQAEKDAAVAVKKAQAVNDFLAAEVQKRRAGMGDLPTWPCRIRLRRPMSWSVACATLGFRGR